MNGKKIIQEIKINFPQLYQIQPLVIRQNNKLSFGPLIKKCLEKLNIKDNNDCYFEYKNKESNEVKIIKSDEQLQMIFIRPKDLIKNDQDAYYLRIGEVNLILKNNEKIVDKLQQNEDEEEEDYSMQYMKLYKNYLNLEGNLKEKDMIIAEKDKKINEYENEINELKKKIATLEDDYNKTQRPNRNNVAIMDNINNLNNINNIINNNSLNNGCIMTNDGKALLYGSNNTAETYIELKPSLCIDSNENSLNNKLKIILNNTISAIIEVIQSSNLVLSEPTNGIGANDNLIQEMNNIDNQSTNQNESTKLKNKINKKYNVSVLKNINDFMLSIYEMKKNSRIIYYSICKLEKAFNPSNCLCLLTPGEFSNSNNKENIEKNEKNKDGGGMCIIF